MFRGILPKEFNFYDYFERHIAVTVKAATELMLLASDNANIESCARRIKELELQADDITHKCTEALHKTFITPIERTDIHSLIKILDDIVDNIDSAVQRIGLYEITEIRSETKMFAEILVKTTQEIELALKGLRDIKNSEYISARCRTIHQLESEADMVLRSAIVRLFKENKPIEAIMWKEIFERMEKAVDKCEAVANIIEGVVISA